MVCESTHMKCPEWGKSTEATNGLVVARGEERGRYYLRDTRLPFGVTNIFWN